MKLTTFVTMDLLKPETAVLTDAVQNDRNSRYLALALVAGGQSWEIPEGTAPVIRYCKPDGIGGEYDTLPDGSSAWSAAGNVLTVALAPQVLTTAGAVRLMVTLIHQEQQLSTFTVIVNVAGAVQPEGEESGEFRYVTGFLPGTTGASVGQFLRITGVDEQGRVTAVEPVDALAATGKNPTITLTENDTGVLIQAENPDGTITEAQVAHGQQGAQGERGPTGLRGPQGIQGPAGVSGYTPVKGVDYYTTAEQAQMKNAVLASLPTLEVVGVDAEGVSHSWVMYGEAQG